MKKGILFLILLACFAAGCIKRNSSGIEASKSAVVYINMSEFYPVGIDTLWVPPGDTTMAFEAQWPLRFHPPILGPPVTSRSSRFCRKAWARM